MNVKTYGQSGWFHTLKMITAGILGVLLVVCSAARVDATNYIVVASYGNGNVYKVPDNFGGAAVGAGQLFASGFSSPYAVATRGDDVYIGQLGGAIYRNGSSAGNLFATSPNQIFDMDFADAGNLHVVGSTSLARVYDSNGNPLGSYSTGNFNGHGIDYDPLDGVYVAHPNSISRLTGAGTAYVDATPPLLAAAFYTSSLQNIVKGPDGSLYTSSYNAENTIFKVDPITGVAIDLFPSSSVTIGSTTYSIQPIGVGIGTDQKLYFTDWFNYYLFRSDLNGGNPEIVATGFSLPAGLDFVPEPNTLALLAIGGLLMWRRSARRDA